jgi:hypothetical protein
LKELGPAARIHRLDKVFEALKGELSTLVKGGMEINDQNAHEVFNSTVRALEASYCELVYCGAQP